MYEHARNPSLSSEFADRFGCRQHDVKKMVDRLVQVDQRKLLFTVVIQKVLLCPRHSSPRLDIDTDENGVPDV